MDELACYCSQREDNAKYIDSLQSGLCALSQLVIIYMSCHVLSLYVSFTLPSSLPSIHPCTSLHFFLSMTHSMHFLSVQLLFIVSTLLSAISSCKVSYTTSHHIRVNPALRLSEICDSMRHSLSSSYYCRTFSSPLLISPLLLLFLNFLFNYARPDYYLAKLANSFEGPEVCFVVPALLLV